MRLEFEPTTIEESGLVIAVDNDNNADALDVRDLLRKGIKAAQAGSRAEARAYLQSVADADPKNENAWLWLASISEYPEELMVFLENVLDINPENKRAAEWMAATKTLLAKTFVQRGIDAVESGHNDFASDCFNSALEHDQNNAMAWLWMASLCNENEGKMAYLERVLAIEPDNESAKAEFTSVRKEIVQSQFQRAKNAAVSGNLKDAVEELSAVLAEAPELEEAWIFKSHIVDNFSDKIQTLEEALRHHPDSLVISSSLISLKAIVDSTNAVSSQPENINTADLEEVIAVSADSVDADEEVIENDPASEYVEYFADELVVPATINTEDPVTSSSEVEQELSSPWENTADDEQTGLTETYFAPQEAVQSVENNDDDPLILSESQESSEQLNDAAEEVLFDPYLTSDRVPEWGNYPEENSDEVMHSLNADMPEAADLDAEHSYNEVPTTQDEPSFDPILTEQPAQFEEDLSSVQSDAELLEQTVEQPPVYSFDEAEQSYQELDQPELQAIYEETNSVEELPFVSSDSGMALSEDAELENDTHVPVIYEAQEVVIEATDDVSNELETDDDLESGIPQPTIAFAEPEPVKTGFETTLVREEVEVKETPVSKSCPYCSTENDAYNYVCNLCMSVFTLSDLELLISNKNADHSLVRPLVDYMAEERSNRELTENELTTLGIGYLNLQDLDKGYETLLEASKINPNNVVLSSQVNSLHIRIEEIRKQAETQETMVRGKTIMVVDDSPTIRKLISGKLEKTGHMVHTAADGLEAVGMINDIMPDLVLLDITMPKMDGYQVCKTIRNNEYTKNIPVVMISGKDGFFDKVRGRMAGTSGYITKPFGPETLMKAVETYLSNGHVAQSETGELQLSNQTAEI